MGLINLFKKKENIYSNNLISNSPSISTDAEIGCNLFPSVRYNNINDMFNNIYFSSTKVYKTTDEERFFINSFIEALEDNGLECACLLSRMSTGELVVYYKNLEVGRVKLNGSRNYLITEFGQLRHFEAKTMNFYISKMKQYWIPRILEGVTKHYIK